MLKNITLGQYFPGDTVVHRLDPRIKILVALLFLVAVFVVRTMWGFFALAVLFILIIALALLFCAVSGRSFSSSYLPLC